MEKKMMTKHSLVDIAKKTEKKAEMEGIKCCTCNV